MEKFISLLHHAYKNQSNPIYVNYLTTYFTSLTTDECCVVLILLNHSQQLKQLKRSELRHLVQHFSELPDWLIKQSILFTKNELEALTLLIPQTLSTEESLTLSEFYQEIVSLKNLTKEQINQKIIEFWKKLNYEVRLLFNKLLIGQFRSPIPNHILANALSNLTHNSLLFHLVILNKNIHHIADHFFTPNEPNNWKTYPFSDYDQLPNIELSHQPNGKGRFRTIYHGTRCHIIKRNESIWLLDSKGELINNNFPEIVSLSQKNPHQFVVEATLTLDHTFVEEIFEFEYVNSEEWSDEKKQHMLEYVTKFFHSNKITFNRWQQDISFFQHELSAQFVGWLFQTAEDKQRFIVKNKRKRIQAVLLYIEKRQIGNNILTFGLSDGSTWFSIAKTEATLPKNELTALENFIKENTLSKTGPIRTVRPQLIFELSFDRILHSKRHLSGIQLQHVKLEKWLHSAHLDTLPTLQSLKSQVKSAHY